jgi:hypothetical protein
MKTADDKTARPGDRLVQTIFRVGKRSQAISIVASSTSMMGISSFTAYTRWHCVHFRLSGFSRYRRACLHAGQTRISNNSLAIMQRIVTQIEFTTETEENNSQVPRSR